MALLSGGLIDIDQGDSQGHTPLMMASAMGNSQVVRILLDKGTNVSMVSPSGRSALLWEPTHRGHFAITRCCLKPAQT